MLGMQRKDALVRILKVVFGLLVFSFGEFVTILGNIGITPWDTLSMGISYHVPLTFGQIHVGSALVILVIDLLMKEKIGLGTVLDALLTGTFVDMWDFLIPFEGATNKWAGLVLLLLGMLIMAAGQVFYMSGGLSCGPRDSLLVAVGKRLPKIPIGYVDMIMKVVIVIVSYLIGGPIGFGTLIAMLGMGVAMQIVYSIFKFEPRNVVHEGIVTTFKHIFEK